MLESAWWSFKRAAVAVGETEHLQVAEWITMHAEKRSIKTLTAFRCPSVALFASASDTNGACIVFCESRGGYSETAFYSFAWRIWLSCSPMLSRYITTISSSFCWPFCLVVYLTYQLSHNSQQPTAMAPSWAVNHWIKVTIRVSCFHTMAIHRSIWFHSSQGDRCCDTWLFPAELQPSMPNSQECSDFQTPSRCGFMSVTQRWCWSLGHPSSSPIRVFGTTRPTPDNTVRP